MSADRPQAMPHDALAEMAVLGSMVLSPEAAGYAQRTLRAEQFHRPAHQDIFKAICGLLDSNTAVDLITLRNALQEAGNLETVGGTKFLTDVMEAVASSANVEHYVRIVQERALQREVIRLCQETTLKARSAGVDWNEFGVELDVAFRNIKPVDAPVPLIATHLDVAAERMERRARGEDTGLRTGVGLIDRKIGGFEPGELVLLLGDSSTGKTALICNILLDLCVRRGRPALFFSAEVIGPTLAVDLVRMVAQRDFWRLDRDGRLSPADYEAWQAAAPQLHGAALYVDDTTGIAIEHLCNRAARMVEEKAVELIAVDYVQLLSTERRFESEVLRLDYIGWSLKRLAGRYRVPVVMLSQMTEGDGGRRDPRFCKALMHHCDTRIDLVRGEPEFDREPENEPDVCTRRVILVKGRHKGTGWGVMEFDKAILTFKEMGVGDGHRIDGGRDAAGARQKGPRLAEGERGATRGRTQAPLNSASPGQANPGTEATEGATSEAEVASAGEDVPDSEIPF